MENLLLKFSNAKSEFINSEASEKSVENLYDIVYLILKSDERNFNENFILAQIYYLLGEIIYAKKIIEKELNGPLNEKEIAELKGLQQKVDNRDVWNIKNYRDLRDAKIVKKPTKINIDQFIVSKDGITFCIEISEKIRNVVILNKNTKNESLLRKNYIAFAKQEPTNGLLSKLSNHIEWLGQLKDELLNFYNYSFFGEDGEGKLDHVDQQWYDGLDVFNFWIKIGIDDNFKTVIIINDYLQNNYGFELKLENKSITSINYDSNI